MALRSVRTTWNDIVGAVSLTVVVHLPARQLMRLSSFKAGALVTHRVIGNQRSAHLRRDRESRVTYVPRNFLLFKWVCIEYTST